MTTPISRIRPLAARILGTVRRGREVAWTPPWMRMGNLLYLGCWAFEGRVTGSPRGVLATPAAAALVPLFPALAETVLVLREDVRITDRRVMPWSQDAQEPRLPEHYDPALLRGYIESLLLPGSPLGRAPRDDLEGALVVNVRRGDYFSRASIRAEFGMDTRGYTLEAVRRTVSAQGAPRRLLVVSDEPAWCQEHLLPALSEVAETRVLPNDPGHDLAMLVHAERLIIPNSTFSYWGGYIGDHLHPGREVLAPWLFSRAEDSGRAHRLRPGWTVVEEIPAGWEATGP